MTKRKNLFNMTFIQAFLQQLELLSSDRIQIDSDAITQKNSFAIAYSGGLDSHVLLHVCHSLNLPIRAIHVHHGLQSVADDWVTHCQQVCLQLNVPLEILHVDAKAQPRQSPEDGARIARYAALENAMQTGETLLTAQHADDQSETFLLQLMRGASAAGLAAMPSQRSLGGGIHQRPLLIFSRDEIEAYATQNKLKWIEDPSNQDTAFDRNFVRQRVLPILKERWPALNNSFSHTVNLQQENLEILEAMAAIDLASVSTQSQTCLSISRLLRLSVVRQKNALRFWIKQNSEHQPTRKLLGEIHSAVLSASEDASPCVKWGQSEIRRYQSGLYLLSQTETFDATQSFIWQAGSELEIEGVGNLSRQIKTGCSVLKRSNSKHRGLNHQGLKLWGLKQMYFDLPLQVRFRQGGERLQLAGHAHSRRLKSLLQEAGIPPWQREKIPLIYCEETLIAVSELWIAAGSEAAEDEGSWVVSLQHSAVKSESK